MLRLYDYEGSANGYKIRLLLAHLGRPYTLVPVEIFTGEAQTDAFLARNPAGRVPVIELDDGSALAESSAILFYLATDTPLLPAGPLERARVLQWLSFEQDNVESTLGTARFWNLTGRAAHNAEELARRLAKGRRGLDAMERQLAGRDWFVGGRFTVADIALYAYTHVADDAGVDLAAWPRVSAWLARVAALPGHVNGPAPYTRAAMVAAPAGSGSR